MKKKKKKQKGKRRNKQKRRWPVARRGVNAHIGVGLTGLDRRIHLSPDEAGGDHLLFKHARGVVFGPLPVSEAYVRAGRQRAETAELVTLQPGPRMTTEIYPSWMPSRHRSEPMGDDGSYCRGGGIIRSVPGQAFMDSRLQAGTWLVKEGLPRYLVRSSA